MVLKQASGVWWSRWLDINNADTVKIIGDYESRDLPVSTYVIDMNWHAKYDWSGFTFDSHLYPFPADTMGWLKAQGLAITVNVHDASGINYWEGQFPALVAALGLPSNTTVVPMNLVNASVAYAGECGGGEEGGWRSCAVVRVRCQPSPPTPITGRLPAFPFHVPLPLSPLFLSPAVEDIVVGDLLYKQLVDFM